jgi:sarcosine oxidase delta subunit
MKEEGEAESAHPSAMAALEFADNTEYFYVVQNNKA